MASPKSSGIKSKAIKKTLSQMYPGGLPDDERFGELLSASEELGDASEFARQVQEEQRELGQSRFSESPLSKVSTEDIIRQQSRPATASTAKESALTFDPNLTESEPISKSPGTLEQIEKAVPEAKSPLRGAAQTSRLKKLETVFPDFRRIQELRKAGKITEEEAQSKMKELAEEIKASEIRQPVRLTEAEYQDIFQGPATKETINKQSAEDILSQVKPIEDKPVSPLPPQPTNIGSTQAGEEGVPRSTEQAEPPKKKAFARKKTPVVAEETPEVTPKEEPKPVESVSEQPPKSKEIIESEDKLKILNKKKQIVDGKFRKFLGEEYNPAREELVDAQTAVSRAEKSGNSMAANSAKARLKQIEERFKKIQEKGNALKTEHESVVSEIETANAPLKEAEATAKAATKAAERADEAERLAKAEQSVSFASDAEKAAEQVKEAAGAVQQSAKVGEQAAAEAGLIPKLWGSMKGLSPKAKLMATLGLGGGGLLYNVLKDEPKEKQTPAPTSMDKAVAAAQSQEEIRTGGRLLPEKPFFPPSAVAYGSAPPSKDDLIASELDRLGKPSEEPAPIMFDDGEDSKPPKQDTTPPDPFAGLANALKKQQEEKTDYLRLLQEATGRRDLSQLIAQLGRSTSQIGAGLGGAISKTQAIKPVGEEIYKSITESADQPVSDVERRRVYEIEKRKNDPTSAESELARAMYKEYLGKEPPSNTTAAFLEKMLPSIATLTARKEMAEARKEATKRHEEEFNIKRAEHIRAEERHAQEKEDKDFIRLNEKLANELASSKSTFGKMSSIVQQANQLEALVNRIKDPNKLTNIEIQELATGLDSMLKGGVGTITGAKKLVPESAIGDFKGIVQYLSGVPVGKEQGEFVKRFAETIKSQRDVGIDGMKKTKEKITEGYSHLKKRNPSRWESTLMRHEIPTDEQINALRKQEQQKSKSVNMEQLQAYANKFYGGDVKAAAVRLRKEGYEL